MELNVAKEVARLQRMTCGELRDEFAEADRRNHQRQESQMVDSPNHLAAAGQRGGRPFRIGHSQASES